MLDWGPPDGTEVLIQWLKELAETSDERPTGAVLPYIMVHRVGGGDDRLVDKGRYQIHTFAATKVAAQELASRVHRRMQLLAGQFTDSKAVTISTGVVAADNVTTEEGPVYIQWVNDNSIYRYVATYVVELRYIAM